MLAEGEAGEVFEHLLAWMPGFAMACSRNSYDPDCPTQHIALLLLDKQEELPIPQLAGWKLGILWGYWCFLW